MVKPACAIYCHEIHNWLHIMPCLAQYYSQRGHNYSQCMYALLTMSIPYCSDCILLSECIHYSVKEYCITLLSECIHYSQLVYTARSVHTLLRLSIHDSVQSICCSHRVYAGNTHCECIHTSYRFSVSRCYCWLIGDRPIGGRTCTLASYCLYC